MTCSGVPSIKFVLGEKKYVWFKVISKIEQLFTITDAFCLSLPLTALIRCM